MEYNNLKSIGKVYDFDGEAGTIITPDNEYMFNVQQYKKPENAADLPNWNLLIIAVFME